MPRRIQIAANRLDAPVPVPVDYVAAIAALKQLGVEPRITRPLAAPRTHPVRAEFVAGVWRVGHPHSVRRGYKRRSCQDLNMGIVESILFGALSSLVAATLFLFLLSRVRPRVELSQSLAGSTGADGRERLAFKIRNNSWSSLLDIQAKASLSTNVVGDSQRVGVGIPLDLDYPNLFDIAGREIKRSRKGTSTFVFFLRADLLSTDEVGAEWVIRVGVSSRHVLSQFGGVAKRNYVGARSIIRGEFSPGVSLAVVAVTTPLDPTSSSEEPPVPIGS